MDFYNDLVTEKSWQTLTELRRSVEFVLIGGWAVWLHTRALKSKDIDIIVGYSELEKLRADFAVLKNDRLKKYEARRFEVQIDIYLPHYSNLGIPAEEIIKTTTKIETFTVPSAEMLLILKQLVFRERGLSAKGQKDKLDIISLLWAKDLTAAAYLHLIKNFNLDFLVADLENLLVQTTKVPELGINEHQWAKKKAILRREFSAR